MITTIADRLHAWLIEMVLLYIVLVSAGFTVLLAVWAFLRFFAEYKEPKVVTCPETGAPAVIYVDALHSAIHRLLGRNRMRLTGCSRWNERGPCDQACLSQLVTKPAGEAREKSDRYPEAGAA
jgi:hypothetical protein